MSRADDVADILAPLERAESALLELAETLCEGNDTPVQAAVLQVLGNLQTAKRQVEALNDGPEVAS